MTTARERAKAFVQSYGCGLGSDQTCSGEDCPCVEKAAQALRQAENDKLEEAARICDDLFDHYSMSDHCEQAARNIRSLKSKETP